MDLLDRVIKKRVHPDRDVPTNNRFRDGSAFGSRGKKMRSWWLVFACIIGWALFIGAMVNQSHPYDGPPVAAFTTGAATCSPFCGQRNY